jgi:hypothetical protein
VESRTRNRNLELSSPRKRQSIRQYDSPADRIRQHRQVDHRPVILTEGPNDKYLLEDSFGHKFAVFPAGTRNIAIDAAVRLASWNTRQFACVVDRDFDDVVANAEVQIAHIHAYENADLEAMLIGIGALRRMLLELGSADKLTAFGGLEALKEALFSIVLPAAVLRRANYEQGWGLVFDAVDLASRIERRTLKFNLNGYCTSLSQTVANDPSARVLLEYATGVRAISQQPHCPRGVSPYFRGKDFLAGVGVALRSLIGSCVKSIAEADHLDKVLRLSANGALASSQWADDLVVLLAH